MRVLLFTGKGGVGKTTVAAATALRAAASGSRTLVLSTDPAHSLADVLDATIGPEPTPLGDRLDAQQIDAQQRLADHWQQIQDYLVALLRWSGLGAVEAEELAVLPGLEEIFSLVDVCRHADSGAYDLLVVDCAPTAETLRLLSLPEVLGWYVQRLVPGDGTLSRMLRPVLGSLLGEEAGSVPLPAEETMDAAERLHRQLAAVRELLQDPETTSTRLVLHPERVVVAEARRMATSLSLFGYHIDAVVVNRVLPEAVTDPYFARWKELHATHLQAVRDGFAGVPVLAAPLFDDELVGAAALERLAAALYGQQTGHELLHRGRPLEVDAVDDGYELSLALPFVERGEVDLYRRGEELYVKAGGRTRSLMLPAALQRRAITGAQLQDGRLRVRFDGAVRGGHTSREADADGQ